MKKKCIIVCNGPSVSTILKHNLDFTQFDIIAVNRWNRIFNILEIKDPDYVVIGKNSLKDNLVNLKYKPDIKYFGIDPYIHTNYKQLTFGFHNIDIKNNDDNIIKFPINFIGSLWWSGIYAIQLALKLGYEHIYVYGFTCTNDKDYVDTINRSSIPIGNFKRVQWFFNHLRKYGLLNRITFYENKEKHPLRNILFP